MNRCLPTTLMMFVFLTLAVPSLLRADAKRVSVTDLEDTPALIGQRLELEGRVASRGPDRLRLEACGVEFRFTPSPRIARFRLQRVKIVGTLTRRGKSLRFEIETLRTLPSEKEEFRRRQDRIRAGDVQGWYALGSWAQERAVLYDDGELRQLADEAHRRGLSAEERRAGEDPDALLALSRRAREVAKLPSEAARLTFRAYQLLFARIQEREVDGLEDLARQIAGALPGCDEPLSSEDAALVRRATADALRTYREVDEPERRKLHRILWADVTERLLTIMADKAPKRGLEIAERAARLIPERPELADALKRRGLDAQALDVSAFSRDQAVAVAEGYRSLLTPQPNRARRILEDWTAARRAQLGPRDADGRLSLARDVLALLADRDEAISLLSEAWRLAPDLPGLADELQNLGLVRVGSKWTEADKAARSKDAEIERLIRLGQVVPGMTASQVLRSQGRPDQVTRIAGSQHVLEQWVFLRGTVTMRVNLVRHREVGTTEVVSVHSGR